MEKHLEYLNQLDKNEIDNFKRTWMHNLVTMKWLKTRHVDKAKKQYLFFPDELHKHYEINELFRGFDANQSEGIDIQELISMFKDNSIILDKQDVEAIFKIIDFNGDNTLNLSEFKKGVFSGEINSQFAKIMRDLREKIEKKDEQESKKKNQSYSMLLGSMSKIGEAQQKGDNSNRQFQKKLTKIFVKVPTASNSSISNMVNENSQRSNSDKNINEQAIEKEEEQTQRVVPTTFSSMVEFFSYNFQRKEQIKKCKNLPSTSVGQKVNELSNLINLSSKYTEHSLQKIQKLSNKYRFHSFNLLSEAEQEPKSPTKSINNNSEKENDTERNNENCSSTSQLGNHRKISQSLSPQKYQNNQNSYIYNYQISSIPEIDNFDQSNCERTGDHNAEVSSIVNSPVPSKLNQKQATKLSLPQSPDSFSKLTKRKNQSVDNSNSTQDKTNIDKSSSIQQFNQYSSHHLNSTSQHQTNSSSIKISPPFFNFNKDNTKIKLRSNNLSQQDLPTCGLNNNDISNKRVSSSRNSSSTVQANKLSKILNEFDQQKKESFQKFLVNQTSNNNSTHNQSQTNYGFKRIQIKKPLEINLQAIKIKPNTSIQQSNTSQQESIEAGYKDAHLLNGSAFDNKNRFFINNNPFSKKKRSSHFMSSTIASFNKEQQIKSLQNSPRINFNQKIMSQKPSNPDTQANSMVSLLDELAGADLRKQSQQIYYPPLNNMQVRKEEKNIQEIQSNQMTSQQSEQKECQSWRQRNNSLPHFVLPQSYNQMQGQHIRNQSQQNANNNSLKTILQMDNKQKFPNKAYFLFEKQNEKAQQNFDIKIDNLQKNQEGQTEKMQQEDDQKKELQEKMQEQANIQMLTEKKRQMQIPFQQNQLKQTYSSNHKPKMGLQNFFVKSSNKKKMDSIYKVTNGMVTTPSSINESLMATLNNFNLQKNLKQNNFNNQNNF